jgi:predicted DsbA family dithiol-disulfide isomerase
LRPDAPETGWALPEHIRANVGRADNPLQLRARRLGITLAERTWIPSSRRAHECTEHARKHGKLEPFSAAVLRAYWNDGRDLHEWDVLQAAAREAGVDAGAMRAEVETGALRAEVDRRLEAAHELGIHAVPTFAIANRYAIQGAQTAEVFEQMFARLAAGDEA